MKQHLQSLIRFFSSSTPRTIGLLLFVTFLGVGIHFFLEASSSQSNQRIADYNVNCPSGDCNPDASFTPPPDSPIPTSSEGCITNGNLCAGGSGLCCSGFCNQLKTCAENPNATPVPTIPGSSPAPTAPTAAPTINQTTPEPTASASSTPRPTSSSKMIVAFQVILPGIGNDTGLGVNKAPLHPTRSFTVQFLDSKGTVVAVQDGELTYTDGLYKGDIAVSNVPAGNYIIKIKSQNSLFKALPGVKKLVSSETLLTQPITLVTGNLDETNASKNVLDLFDYNLVLSGFGKANDISDLNDDGITDGKDLNILLRGFATRKGD